MGVSVREVGSESIISLAVAARIGRTEHIGVRMRRRERVRRLYSTVDAMLQGSSAPHHEAFVNVYLKLRDEKCLTSGSSKKFFRRPPTRRTPSLTNGASFSSG